MVVAVRNKFELLVILIASNIDVLMTSETKIGESFPVLQFLIEGSSSPRKKSTWAEAVFQCSSK